jgi:hypothetical protein
VPCAREHVAPSLSAIRWAAPHSFNEHLPPLSPTSLTTLKKVRLLAAWCLGAYVAHMYMRMGWVKFDPAGFWTAPFERWGYPVWLRYYSRFFGSRSSGGNSGGRVSTEGATKRAQPNMRLQVTARGVFISLLLLAPCRHPVEVRGLYANDHGPGNFLSCDQPKTIVLISDSALAARYRLTATPPHRPVFVRLRGFPVDSGSIYGGKHYFLVQRILEIRLRRNGECPGGSPVLPL